MKSPSRFKQWVSKRLEYLLDNIIWVCITAIGAALWYAIDNNLLGNTSFLSSTLIARIVTGTIILLVLIIIWKYRRLLIHTIKRIFRRDEANASFSRLFVGRQKEIETFENILSESTDRILAFHGVGGTGKSWLLEKYKNICRKRKIPFASMDCATDKSTIEVLSRLASDLERIGLKLPDFSHKFGTYEAVLEKMRLQQMTLDSLAQSLEKSSAVGHGAVNSALRTLLESEELSLYNMPEGFLVRSLISDISRVENKRRLIALFVDTFEQAGSLEHWLVELIEELPKHIVAVIAGRSHLGDVWRRPNIRIKQMELSCLDLNDSQKCVETYCKEYLAKTLPIETEQKILQFAQGLPLAVSLAVDIMSTKNTTEMCDIQKEVVESLVEIMIRDTDDSLYNTLEICSFMPWLNEDILSFLLPSDINARQMYRRLRKAPYTRSYSKGLLIHDRVREFICLDFKVRAPEKYKTWALKSADWFAREIAVLDGDNKRFSEDWKHAVFERVRCLFLSGSTDRWKEFRHRFMESACCSQTSFCRDLISSIPADDSFWSQYYEGRLAMFKGDFDQGVRILEGLLQEKISGLLAAYIYDALGPAYYAQARYNELLEVNQRALELSREMDQSLIPDNLDGIGWAHLRLGDNTKSIQAFLEGLDLATKQDDYYWIVKHTYNLAVARETEGNITEAISLADKALSLMQKTSVEGELYAALIDFKGALALEQGDNAKAEALFRQAIACYEHVGRHDRKAISLFHIGEVFNRRKEYSEALKSYQDGQAIAKEYGQKRYEFANLVGILEVAMNLNRGDIIDEFDQRVNELSAICIDQVLSERLKCIIRSIQ